MFNTAPQIIADLLTEQPQYDTYDIPQAAGIKLFVEKLISTRKEHGLRALKANLASIKANNERYWCTLTGNPPEAKEPTIPESPESEPGKQEEDNRRRLDERGKLIFRTMSEDDIDELPAIECLIAGTLQRATVSLVFGDSNVGKTFFALHTAQCVARGMQWFGRNVKAGKVLYIYAEGIRGLKPRTQAWRKHHEQDKTADIHYIGFPVGLIEEKQTLIDTVTSLPDQYELVVIDTFSNCTVGTNQNDQMEIAKALQTAHELVRDYGCHVMVVHHTNNSGKFNGSAAFKNHVDTMISLTRTDTGPISVHCEKQRDAEYFSDFLLDLEIVNLGMDEDLHTITSCVMVLSNAKNPAMEKAEQERSTMLAVLKEHAPMSQAKWMEWSKEEGISRRVFTYHLERLKTQKMFVAKEGGKGKAIIYEMAPCSNESITGECNDSAY